MAIWNFWGPSSTTATSTGGDTKSVKYNHTTQSYFDGNGKEYKVD